MKFKVTFKDPDSLHEQIDQAVDDSLKNEGMPRAELDAVHAVRSNALKELCSEWFEYGEYLTVEIDTEARTCTVVPV